MSTSTQSGSRYAADPRVTVHPPGGGYTVIDGAREFNVLPTDAYGWVICEGPNLEFAPMEGGPNGLAIGFSDADGAIYAIIREPQGDQS